MRVGREACAPHPPRALLLPERITLVVGCGRPCLCSLCSLCSRAGSRAARSRSLARAFFAVPLPCTAVKIGGKAPVAGGAAFVAPSANLIGAVHMGDGSSAWYAALLKSSSSTVEIGEMSSVGDRAIVVDSVVGKYVHIGAGAIVQSAKLGDESSVGMGCKIGTGASLGAGSALAAGSVLRAGTAVPAGELWGGNPAKLVSKLGAEAAAGTVATAEVTAGLAKLHQEEAWKDLGLVNQEHDDYKREAYRTPDFVASLRADPKWVPLPTLGSYLTKIGVHSTYHTPP